MTRRKILKVLNNLQACALASNVLQHFQKCSVEPFYARAGDLAKFLGLYISLRSIRFGSRSLSEKVSLGYVIEMN